MGGMASSRRGGAARGARYGASRRPRVFQASHGRMRLVEALSVVSDENVPEGHAGLHDELYGKKAMAGEGAEGGGVGRPHEAVVVNDLRDLDPGELDGTAVFNTEEWLARREGTKPCGLYAIYDAGDRLRFVGYSRNIVLAIRGYAEVTSGADSCEKCRIRLISGKRLTSRSYMEAQRDAWVEELAGAEGLKGDEGVKVGSVGSVRRTEAEEAAHEEQKLKMRKAMGDSLHEGDANEDETKRQRRLNTIKAVEGDDWSEVIDRQTRSTREDAPKGESSGTRVSPFEADGAAKAREGAAGAGAGAVSVAFDVDGVNSVLDEVRPYLIADGGNVSVVSVEAGVVKLELEGACGTCPSATATMSMGIERALRKHFGAELKEVVRVDPGAAMVAGGEGDGVTGPAVDAHLDMLRPAVENYGGKVKVKSAEGSVCVVQYKGPPPLAKGIQAAIKDRFPTLTTIKIESF